MSEKGGGEFLNIKDPGLQKSDQVERSVKKEERTKGLETPNNPTDRTKVFLDRLENIFENPDTKTKDRNIELFKNRFLYPAVLVDKNNVPDSYLELQIKIARVEGRGGDLGNTQTAKDIPIEIKKQYGETLYKDQKNSLDNWIDYLSSPDASYPTWFKYYTLKSVLKLGTYDKENHAFKNRLKDTVAPFPELNRAALAKVNDILINKYGTEYFQLREEISTTENKLKIMDDYERRLIVAKTGKDKEGKELHIKKKDLEKMEQSLLRNPVSEISRDELTKKLTDLTDKQKQYLQLRNIPDKFTGIPEEEDFGKIYAYAIHEMTPASKENKEKIEGSWTKFNKGDDPTALFESLQGHGLEWCTAGGMETARTQLKNGDFYVYYSKDEDGHNTIPRIAIRMENGQVAEVRGINPNQNLEANMTDIAQEKYHQLPGGEKFDKKDHDMKLLTLIDTKVNNDQELTEREIIFLYELEGSIEGFGYQKDSRIKEITSKRNIKSDFSFIFDCKPEQISTTQEEALKGNIKFHYGDLDLSHLTSAKNLILPKTIFGSLNLSRLNFAKDLILPETINGDLHLGLTSAKDLILPKINGGDLYLPHLTFAESLTLPETINGDLNLSSLISAKNLILPNTINGDLNLSSLTSSEDLVLPNTINGDLNLSSLTSSEDLVLSYIINGDLNLSSLISAKDLILPYTINGNLNLSSLISAKDLVLPDTLYGDLNLSSLISAKDLILPNNINGSLNLSSLISAKDLVLPDTLYGNLNLSSLTSAERLTLPETIFGSIDLSSLTSAKDLILPNNINGSLNLSSLTSAKDLVLPSIHRYLILSSLTSVKDLVLPYRDYINLYSPNLTSDEKQLLRQEYPKLDICDWYY